ncbi:YbaB/EbfC family nucleoid-associated protein [Paractinoplanes atraurantiacus]|uniref:Conserved DNA-binding protein YbaB n=1 Tax=Paractinoplanes atraurantiacus TaxID=1036182 RepID=A0A285KBA4_9ACTN|nr:YbaB/EbfC family nucleoid-associated protein [Actinoplanes atraurantiacus]SNY69848.1 Conserved DNA-binding protein YbaB [Actinoplanes atraurantiacus]
MTSPMHNRLEEMMAELERHKAAIGDLQNGLASSETNVTSKSRAITVTVDGQGELTGIRFVTNAYRSMAPAELASLIVETVREAREKSRAHAVQLFSQVMPSGIPIMEMLNGPVDFDSAMADIQQAFRDAESDRPGRAGDQP